MKFPPFNSFAVGGGGGRHGKLSLREKKKCFFSLGQEKV